MGGRSGSGGRNGIGALRADGRIQLAPHLPQPVSTASRARSDWRGGRDTSTTGGPERRQQLAHSSPGRSAWHQDTTGRGSDSRGPREHLSFEHQGRYPKLNLFPGNIDGKLNKA